MTKRTSLSMPLLLVAGATLVAAQPPGGRSGGRGMPGMDRERMEAMRAKMEALNTLDIETMWAVLSLQLALDPVKLDTLRTEFSKSWSRRSSILAKTGDDTRWDAIRDEFEDLDEALDEKIEEILDKEELRAFKDGVKAEEKLRPRPPGR